MRGSVLNPETIQASTGGGGAVPASRGQCIDRNFFVLKFCLVNFYFFALDALYLGSILLFLGVFREHFCNKNKHMLLILSALGAFALF